MVCPSNGLPENAFHGYDNFTSFFACGDQSRLIAKFAGLVWFSFGGAPGKRLVKAVNLIKP